MNLGYLKLDRQEKVAFNDFRFSYFESFSFYLVIVCMISESIFWMSDIAVTRSLYTQSLKYRFSIYISMVLYVLIYSIIKKYTKQTIWKILIDYIFLYIVYIHSLLSMSSIGNDYYLASDLLIVQPMIMVMGFASPLWVAIVFQLGLYIPTYIFGNYAYVENMPYIFSINIPFTFGMILMLFVFGGIIYDMYLKEKQQHSFSVTDPLTRVNNRNILADIFNDGVLDYNIRRNFSVAILDIDHFKNVNDTLGHDKGDSILIFIANKLKEHTRKQDYVIRWGGEEFVILFADSVEAEALETCERLRRDIENSDNGIKNVTVSIGVAEYEGGNINQSIDNADKALYYAKEHGRNQVVRYSSVTA